MLMNNVMVWIAKLTYMITNLIIDTHINYHPIIFQNAFACIREVDKGREATKFLSFQPRHSLCFIILPFRFLSCTVFSQCCHSQACCPVTVLLGDEVSMLTLWMMKPNHITNIAR